LSGSCAQIKAVSRTIFASWVFMQLGQTLCGQTNRINQTMLEQKTRSPDFDRSY
jgi:hypothetical protein